MNIEKCRVCSSVNLHECINLGEQPWCNDFVLEGKVGYESTYPLVCGFCKECSTLQVMYTVPKEIMYADHTYLSGSNKVMSKHFQSVSDYVCNELIDDKGLVVDIGSNDGTLLSTYKKNGMIEHGVEACSKTAQIALNNGIYTDAAFFSYEYAIELCKRKGRAKVISAANVFYHVEELHGIVDGVRHLLEDDGVFVVQASYLPNLIETKAFDIMYHEHLLYYRVENLNTLLKLHGLEIFDVQEAPVHGGSIVVYSCHKGTRPISERVHQMILNEREKGYHKIDVYRQFDADIQKLRADLVSLIDALKAQGKTIYAYGAPAKGTVMLNYCGFTHEKIDLAVEVNGLKFNRFIPCTGIPIIDEATVNEPDYYLLLSWNFAPEFYKSEAFQSGRRNFILPLPEPKIINQSVLSR